MCRIHNVPVFIRNWRIKPTPRCSVWSRQCLRSCFYKLSANRVSPLVVQGLEQDRGSRDMWVTGCDLADSDLLSGWLFWTEGVVGHSIADSEDWLASERRRNLCQRGNKMKSSCSKLGSRNSQAVPSPRDVMCRLAHWTLPSPHVTPDIYFMQQIQAEQRFIQHKYCMQVDTWKDQSLKG